MSLGGCDNFCGSFGVVNALQSNLPYKRPPKQRRLSGRLIREVIRLLEPNYRESLPRICPVPQGGGAGGEGVGKEICGTVRLPV